MKLYQKIDERIVAVGVFGKVTEVMRVVKADFRAS